MMPRGGYPAETTGPSSSLFHSRMHLRLRNGPFVSDELTIKHQAYTTTGCSWLLSPRIPAEIQREIASQPQHPYLWTGGSPRA